MCSEFFTREVSGPMHMKQYGQQNSTQRLMSTGACCLRPPTLLATRRLCRNVLIHISPPMSDSRTSIHFSMMEVLHVHLVIRITFSCRIISIYMTIKVLSIHYCSFYTQSLPETLQQILFFAKNFAPGKGISLRRSICLWYCIKCRFEKSNAFIYLSHTVIHVAFIVID